MPRKLADRDYVALAEFRHQLRCFLAFSEAEARDAGLNPQQHQLLLAVRGHTPGAPSVRELAERLVLRHNTVVELIDRMGEHGLVRREQSTADRRRILVHLTPAGEELLDRLSVAHKNELARAGPALVSALLSILEVRKEKT